MVRKGDWLDVAINRDRELFLRDAIDVDEFERRIDAAITAGPLLPVPSSARKPAVPTYRER